MSKDEFSAEFKRHLNESGLNASEVARIFQVDRSTVSRWASGGSAPHPIAREVILGWLIPMSEGSLEVIPDSFIAMSNGASRGES